METASSCEGLVGMYQTTRRHIAKYTSLDWYQHWNHLAKSSVNCRYQMAPVSVEQVEVRLRLVCAFCMLLANTTTDSAVGSGEVEARTGNAVNWKRCGNRVVVRLMNAA
jgi:hypothetical protein